MGIRIDRHEEEKEEIQSNIMQHENNRIYEDKIRKEKQETWGDEGDQEHTEEEENNYEEYEEEHYKENKSEEDTSQNSQNNYERIENEELKDFFENGEFEIINSNEEEEEPDDDEEIEKFVGDAKDTILFFMCMWLFLLSLKYPGDFMTKMEFVNEFIDKRERQIKRMVDKIDRVLKRYGKMYKMLVEFGDWTFVMDIAIITLTFQAELEDKLGEMQEHEGDVQDDVHKENGQFEVGIENLQNSRITALIGGTEQCFQY